MIRQIFFGTEGALSCDLPISGPNRSGPQEQQAAVCFGTNCVLPTKAYYSDAKPREIFIAASFLALIVGIGFYPNWAMNAYDVSTVAVNAQVRQSQHQIAQANPKLYAEGLSLPNFTNAEVASVLGTVE